MDPRLVTAIAVVVGVPAVLFGYIVLRSVPAALPGPAKRGSGRGYGCAGPAFLFVFLVYPTIGTIIRSFQNKRPDQVRRARQLRLLLHQPVDPRTLKNNVLWVILLTAVHRQLRHDHRGPRRPRPL